MVTYNIAVLCGDGIGKETTLEAVKVLKAVGKKYEHIFNIEYFLIGKDAYKKTGSYFPDFTKNGCDVSDAILFGAVEKEPLLEIRKRYDFFTNIRPIKGNGLNITIFRELTGGIYFGESGEKIINGIKKGFYTMEYSEDEIVRIAKAAFNCAKKTNQHIISIDKNNALPHIKWRDIVEKVSKDFPNVQLNHLYIDNALMQLYKNPRKFKIVLISNLFGDIFSDLAAEISGSIGLIPSASLNKDGFGLFEPIHGTAPDISGKNIANPIASIRAVIMMLEQFKLTTEASSIESAISKILVQYVTKDMDKKDKKIVGTNKIGSLIAKEILK